MTSMAHWVSLHLSVFWRKKLIVAVTGNNFFYISKLTHALYERHARYSRTATVSSYPHASTINHINQLTYNAITEWSADKEWTLINDKMSIVNTQTHWDCDLECTPNENSSGREVCSRTKQKIQSTRIRIQFAYHGMASQMPVAIFIHCIFNVQR